MAITVRAGKNGLVYVSGTELVGANSWSVAIDAEAIEYSYFGKIWMGNLVGLKSWSGSIEAIHDQDSELLQDAAIATILVALLIYPDNTDVTTYYSGNAIFGASPEGSMDSPVTISSDFTGDDALTMTGFTA